jgi:hypothetical protein
VKLGSNDGRSRFPQPKYHRKSASTYTIINTDMPDCMDCNH